jgi:site-specific recombinase XerD
MLSESCPDPRKNSSDNVFGATPVDPEAARLFAEYLLASDYSDNSRRAVINDLRKFAEWFVASNHEPLSVARITTRDVGDFRDTMRQEKQQAVATVNRSLVSVRRFLQWCHDNAYSPGKLGKVKELRKQELAPKGLESQQVRKLLREVELRNDVRANAIFSFLLFTGCRVGDVAGLSMSHLLINERSGTAVFRNGKGNKQRSVPVAAAARKALAAYFATRPPTISDLVFVGERGPLTEKGIRSLCEKYSVICGFHIHPHVLRHTFSHQYLNDNPGDLVGLAQILGHENLNTTRRYVTKSQQQLSDGTDRMSF